MWNYMVNCNGVKLIWYMIKKSWFLHFPWIFVVWHCRGTLHFLKNLRCLFGSFETTWRLSEVNIPKEKYSLHFFLSKYPAFLLLQRILGWITSKMGHIYIVLKNGGHMGCLVCCWVFYRQCWKQLALRKLQVSDDTPDYSLLSCI